MWHPCLILVSGNTGLITWVWKCFLLFYFRRQTATPRAPCRQWTEAHLAPPPVFLWRSLSCPGVSDWRAGFRFGRHLRVSGADLKNIGSGHHLGDLFLPCSSSPAFTRRSLHTHGEPWHLWPTQQTFPNHLWWWDLMFQFSSVEFSSIAQSCPTLCYLMDCSPPGSTVPGILQARILE